MGTVDFDAFDADNHYYEATDAFTRHLPANRSRLVTWATINGKPRMVVDNKVFRFIPNPTFDPVAKPGVLDEYFRGKRAGDSIRDAFGDLEPINPAYREPEARLKLMDEQRLQGCFMFPTLGVGVEDLVVSVFDESLSALGRSVEEHPRLLPRRCSWPGPRRPRTGRDALGSVAVAESCGKGGEAR